MEGKWINSLTNWVFTPFDEDDVSDGRDKLISADDEQPTRKLGVKKSMFKKPQNSIKPRAKSLLKK